jgi:hypothetical protein
MPTSPHLSAAASTAATAPSPSANATKLHLLDVPLDRPPEYINWEAVSLQHFVDRYIRTLQRPVNRDNRLIVQQAMGRYQGRFPARCADVEQFLDSILKVTAAR